MRTSAAPQETSAAPRLALIAAVARNGVIGAAGALPWRLAADLRHFRALTTGHAVIMGRRTWESIGRALPDRQNIVVSTRAGFGAEGAQVVASLPAALACVARPLPAFCIGGGELYRAALPLADRIYLTEIDRDFEGDAHFPSIDPAGWREVERTPSTMEGPEGFAYAFVTYARRAAGAPRP